MNYGGSSDGALLAIQPNGQTITAFRNGNIWDTGVSDYLIRNSDLESAIGIIRLSEGNIKTFRQALTGRINRITILAFSQVSDNPFSFDAGFAIAFHSGLLDNINRFQLIGMNFNGTVIEPQKLDFG